VVAITATVIVITLLGQGAVLPVLVRLFGFSRIAQAEEELVRKQRRLGETEAAAAALQCLSQLEQRGRVPRDEAARLRRVYQDRLREAPSQGEGAGAEASVSVVRSQLIQAERARILALRRDGKISDQALGRLERSLDLREALVD
jgi:CPA1 family monovalent cation:H+ antiporter